MTISLKQLLDSATDFAKKGGDSTLVYFRESFDLEFKEDDSPVTNADRKSEQIIRDLIKTHYPDHGIIGEEFGSENTDSEYVWVLDPIDGTQSFIHGIPFYTTLIGILHNNEPVVGIIYAPALGEMVSAAKGLGCELNGKPCSVRECTDLSKATFITTDVDNIKKYYFEEAFEELLDKTRIHRTWGDGYGHLMVATGRADIMFDPILNIWDAAALYPVITEAGGVFMDVKGKSKYDSGNGISCSKELRIPVLSAFR